MTFGIQGAESLLEGLSREVHARVNKAREALTEPADIGSAAHGSRRTLKRARALLKLALRASITDGNRMLRDAGRCVAPVRDSDVLVETVRLVRRSSQHGQFENAAWEELLTELEDRRRVSFATALTPAGPFAKAVALLGSFAIEWCEGGDVGEREVLRVGLTTSYESVRAHSDKAFCSVSDAKAHHTLRKRVKDLRHQIEFLSPVAHDTLRPMATELHHLSDLLGDANDLVVLARYLDSATTIAEAQRTQMVADLTRRRETLWTEAQRLGLRVLAGETADFVGRIEGGWVSFRPQG